MPIRVDHVAYSYRRRRVLHSIDLDIGRGGTLLLGPNGAGKSTLLEVLASVRPPAQGSVTIDGVGGPGPGRAQRSRYLGAIAWLPQAVALYPGVNLREHVAISGWLKGMSKRDAWDASERALARVSLSDHAQDSVKSLSGGQVRRLGIAGALVHDAEVVLLDEPTANLDPAQRRQFRALIEELAEDRTVLVSSHDTDDAMTAFREVIVLTDGRVRFAGTAADFIDVADHAAGDGERVQLAYIHWAGEPSQ